ncbi:hypothetical protein [Streptomyces sp. ISL-100]|uniref:hypothetical protein n=1 Tax=Streptomyces sp. ISL-100 TaxID=2819173 RepID=UPI001BE5E71B|nr:hypothetical protein [Streptomyces sp. ISL-100]MBT2395241.1 hypothetical protein [Streptomyces sp. ISL-100]
MSESQSAGLVAGLEALLDAPPTRKGPPCTVGTVLASVDGETGAALRRILGTPEVSSTAIAEVLNQHGREVTSYTVARHRRRGAAHGCRCAR